MAINASDEAEDNTHDTIEIEEALANLELGDSEELEILDGLKQYLQDDTENRFWSE